MSASKNEPQQQQYQRQLLELVNQPGNNLCADCRRKNPRWTSYSLGIFICVRCATIHWKMSPHISKVKSLTMDSWTEDQVQLMQSMGNERVNSIYDPNELRNPPPPAFLGDEESNDEMERYIRDKYEYKKFMEKPGNDIDETNMDKPDLVASKLGSSQHYSKFTLPQPSPRSRTRLLRFPSPLLPRSPSPFPLPTYSDLHSAVKIPEPKGRPEDTRASLPGISGIDPPASLSHYSSLIPSRTNHNQYHPVPSLPSVGFLVRPPRSFPSSSPPQQNAENSPFFFEPSSNPALGFQRGQFERELDSPSNLQTESHDLDDANAPGIGFGSENSSPAQEEPEVHDGISTQDHDPFKSAGIDIVRYASQQGTSMKVGDGPSSCWIAAERAMQHLLRQSTSINKAFEQRGLPQSSYCIQPGFDESLIMSNVGYLEQIHIFLAIDLDATFPLLSDLGKLCTPFSSILFTPSRRHFLPVFKHDGSIWDFNEFVFFTVTKMANAGVTPEKPLAAVNLSTTQNVNSNIAGFNTQEPSRNEGGGKDGGSLPPKKGEGRGIEPNDNDDEESAEENSGPPEDPDDPPEGQAGNHPDTKKISFEICTSISSKCGAINRLQRINVAGSLIIKTTPLTKNPPKPPSRQVNFTRLVFNTKADIPVSYKQVHVKVGIDSKQEIAVIEAVHPMRTSYYHEGETVSSSMSTTKLRRGITALTSLIPRLQIRLQNTDQQIVGVESRRNRSAISQYEDNGVVHWGFHIGDPNLQKGGIDMRAQRVLPSVEFTYVGNNDLIPEPPPSSIDTVISSLWSSIPRDTPNASNSPWIQELLDKMKSKREDQPPAYSNLFNVVFLKTTLDSSSKTHSSHYKADLVVKQGVTDSVEVKRLADKQFKFETYNVNDMKELTTFGIPMIDDVEL